MFELEIETGNAALHDEDAALDLRALAEVLRGVADKLEFAHVGGSFVVRDANGNRVGEARFTGTDNE